MKICTLVICSLLACLPSLAMGETFSVATLNVDGLPLQVMSINVNPDGPGSEGTKLISQYLAAKNYDMVFFQEDFNYHDELTTSLADNYAFDVHSGDVSIDPDNFDMSMLLTIRFECDGLGACLKNNHTLNSMQRTAWTDYYGRLDHAWDGMVTKGFRRYEVTLHEGTQIVVYNMHMDASDDSDEASGNDEGDRLARLSQWTQLVSELKGQLDDGRPIIVLGDMNSYYSRDNIEEVFVKPIEDTGKATVTDVWKEMGSNSETLDKIFCINPVSGVKLKPTAFTIDKEGYQDNGKPLGDHYPLATTFEVEDSKTLTILPAESSSDHETKFFSITGQRIAQPQNGIFISKGKKIVVK